MHQSIAAFFQLTQKLAEHLRRLGFGIVKQNNAATGFLKTPEDQIEFGFRRHGLPVGRPDIGAEHRVAFGVQIGDQRRRIGEAGKAEKRRARAVGGFVRRRNSLFDVGFRGRLVHQAQGAIRMAVGMMADSMALGGGAFDQPGHGFGVMSDDKKGRLCALLRQRIEHFRGRRGGAVVEGQHHFMIGEIQRAWVGLKAYGGGIGPTDRERAGDAQRLRSAVRAGSRQDGGGEAHDEKNAKSERKFLHDGFAGLHPRAGGV